jgi:ppGpp synthetase/RelA/SpoT-type nucleotidyltranferase
MIARSIEDKLREEYFNILPDIRRIRERLEAEVRFNLIPILSTPKAHERFEVHSRVKDCESAINALRRRQEGSLFDTDQPNKYSLTQLKDLAGVRVLVFPRELVGRVDNCLRVHFSSWTEDHVPGYKEGDENQALKYFGFCSEEDHIHGEIQIVPMLTGLFWQVEHEAIYKPKPEFKGIAESFEMKERTQDVLDALKAFEEAFERHCKS